MADKKTSPGSQPVPTEGSKREAQDRSRPSAGKGGAESPVDAMHVDAPTQQDNARGHREGLKRKS